MRVWRTIHYTVGHLSIDARILHYVITHIIFPRAFNHSRVLEGDIPIMWAIRHRATVNWRHYICSVMAKSKHKGHLPFAFLVQRILDHFGVPMHTENMKTLTGYSAKFGKRLLEQCKIAKGRGGVWQFTQVHEVEVPEVEVEAEADDDDEEDVAEVEEIAEPEGGFSFRDVMRGINAALKRIGKMAVTHKKWRKSQVEKGNKRFKHIQSRFANMESRLGRLEASSSHAAQYVEGPHDQQDAGDVSDEEEEESESDED